MKGHLIEKEISVPEDITKELQSIIYKYRKHKILQSEDEGNTYQKSMKRKDPESFQKEYSMSKYPGDIEEALQKQKNMTIKDKYLQKNSSKFDWLFYDMHKDPYIKEKYGMGVPLFFTTIKMILFLLYIIYFINLFGGFNLFEVCQKPQGCFSLIYGGYGRVDIQNLPKNLISTISFLAWIIFSYILKIYIRRVCDQDDDIRQTYVDESNQLILKYFQQGLNKEQVEQVLKQKMNIYSNNMEIELPPDIKIVLSEVTPITNFYKISQKIKQSNKLYVKIIKTVQNIDNTIMKPQNVRRHSKSSVIYSKSIINYFAQKEDQEQQEQVEQKINQRQNSKEDMQQKDYLLQQDTSSTQQNSDFEEFDQKIKFEKIESNNIQFSSQEDEEIQNRETNSDDNSKLSQQNDFKQLKFTVNKNDIEANQKESSEQRTDNEKENLFEIINEFFSDVDEFIDQTISFEQCELFLQQNRKEVVKLIKLLKKYQKKKEELMQEYSSHEALSSSYIIKCKNIQQKQMIQLFLQPTPFFCIFQKLKYIFRDRYYPQNSTHLNINWSTIGMELQQKLIKQFYIRTLGTLQFILSFALVSFIFLTKIYFEHGYDEEGSIKYFWKIFTALAQSVFYLLSERIYGLYSFHMVSSLKSKRICLQISDMYFFYSLSYIILPLVTSLLVSVYNQVEYIKQYNEYQNQQGQQQNEDVNTIPFFNLFISNFIIACLIFSLKAFFPLKWVKSKISQWYYTKSSKYLKKTQYELNKIYKRQKFKISNSIITVFNIVLLCIPISFSLPYLLIIPILLLNILYFVLKYQYLVVFRPVYYCKTIHKNTSSQLCTYIQRISFLSYICFATSAIIIVKTVLFYFTLFIGEIIIKMYSQFINNKQMSTRRRFINSMEGYYLTQTTHKMNKQLKNAVESYQIVSSFNKNNLINSQFNNFYFNQKQIQNRINLEQSDSQNEEQSMSKSNISMLKKQLYSFEQAYSKYQLIQEQQKNFHLSYKN